MLDALFKPKAVAIIGASTKELSIGNVIIKNLQEYGYKGEIYPINPTAPSVRGIKAYKSLDELPGKADLAHVIIPSVHVPQTIEACGKNGIKAVIINSAGFSEMGEEGAKLQQAFLDNAKKYGVRVFGPNCQGIINTDPELKAYCNFTFTYPKPGYISVVALSGGVGAIIMQALYDLGIGMRMYASNGNACDISIPEIIRYWGDDEGSKAIILYTEGFKDPKEFLDAAKVVAAKKPVLAMKAARTEQGAKAASSHTGSLAGVDIVTELIFEKTGILSFTDEGEMVRAAMAFATQPVPRGNRVGIITNTGGPAVIATDVLVASGLEVPKLSEKTVAKLKPTQLPEAALENPIDVVATAGASHFRAAMDVLLEEDGIDSIFMNFVTAPFADTHAIAREIAAVSKMGKKPIVCNFMTDLSQERYRITECILREGGVPCYPNPSDAARALGALVKYHRLQQRKIGEPKAFADVDTAKARAMIVQAQKEGRNNLSAAEVYTIFEAYRIPVAAWSTADTADQAVAAAESIGYPVVVKADAETIAHKSDMGGVAVNLKDAAAVRAAAEDMQKRFGSTAGLRFFVQKFVPGGRELIIGAVAARGVGHLVMFGLGGIYVELLKDVIFKLAPVTRVEAQEMVAGLKTSALLNGFRGEKAVDKEAIVNVIERVSYLLSELPMIREMDLNPVLAFQKGVAAVDGRIRI
jgi:acyl-CoA synthetase (NDP forming)